MTALIDLERKRKMILAAQILKKREEKQLEYYRNNPLEWMVERLGEKRENLQWSLYEGYGIHDWDGTKDPFLKIFSYAKNFDSVSVASGTGTGKTFMIARLVLWFLDCFPKNGLVVTSAPTERQLKGQAWREIDKCFKNFKKIRPYATKTTLTIKLDSREGQEDCSRAEAFSTGNGASEEVANNARGYHSPYMLIILEEATGITIPIVKAFVATITGRHNNILAFGNPDSPDDTLSYLPKTYSRFKRVRISGYDHPNVVLNNEIIPGAVTRLKIKDNLDAEGGDEEGFMVKSRIRGKTPDQSSKSLIKRTDVLRQMLDTSVPLETYNALLDPDSQNALGVDVANSERGDKAATAWSLQNIICEVNEFQCPNASDLAYNIIYDNTRLQELRIEKGIKRPIEVYDIPTLDDYQVSDGNIAVDVVGVGVSTANTLDNEDKKFIPIQGSQQEDKIPLDSANKPLYQFSSLRSQLMYELMLDIRDGRLWFYIEDQRMREKIIEELTIIRYKPKSTKIEMESKTDIVRRLGKSPNILDCIAYNNWARKYGTPDDSVFVNSVFF